MRKWFTKTSLMVWSVFLCCIFFVSCSSDIDISLPGKDSIDNPSVPTVAKQVIDLDLIAAMPEVNLKHVPESKGEIYEESEHGVIDYSSASSGYFTAKYTGEKTGNESDIVLLISTPNPDYPKYQYFLSQDEEYYTFTFSEGNGTYNIGMYKRLQGMEFAQLMALECNVNLSDDLLPFLITNHKIRYSGKSLSVKLALELTKDESEFFSQVTTVYSYVISNVTYDTDKAKAAANGELQTYVPDNDQILRSRTGICFDYATLTVAMLRSVDIPAKVTFGFASTGADADPVYHAWVSVYSSELGWVDNVIEFSASGWTRMDPTFSASSNNKSMANFIGDGNNYTDNLHY